MSSIRKFMIFGPNDTLARMGNVVTEGTNPHYQYRVSVPESGKTVDVLVYEEHQKLVNSSLSVTLVIETNGRSVRTDIITTGGRLGFSGSSLAEETPLNEVITDFIVDYSKRFGLTIQEVVEKPNAEAEV